MKSMPSSVGLLLTPAFAAIFAACGAPATVATPPAPTPSTAPTPAPVITTPAPVTAPRVTLTEPPRNWQLLDQTADHVPGISSERAMHELLSGKSPKQTVLVAIIDNGIDTAQVDLKPNLWINPKAGPGGGNGYVGDVHGWNFIGGRDGRNVHFDTFEVTRQYAACHGRPGSSGQPKPTDAAFCHEIDSAYSAQHDSVEKHVANYRQISAVVKQIVPILKQAANISSLPDDSLTEARVRAVGTSSPQLAQAREIFLELAAQGATPAAIEDGLKSLEGQLSQGLNPDFNPRTIVGDTYVDTNERNYGNADVMGPEAKHGTHVAGIIGAVRGNGVGVDGIAPAVRFMMIRTVPDGDERDKDVANAIRFATDHGAQIISMSFGKPFSPFKAAVDDAVKYADSHGVLMVHAAGNDGNDLAKGHNYPTPVYLDGGHPLNWIEVGASSWKGGDSLAASFSNYGKNEVDVFAPGVDILSTVPGNQYERDSGTSMAAPVVSGLAALIMSYYPTLNATEVRRIILGSASRYNQMVRRPGGEKTPLVSFGSLSVSGGIVNAYNAIKMADDIANGRVHP